MITVEEIPLSSIGEFWAQHMEYLEKDGYLDDDEDRAYFSGAEYRGIIESHMQREPDRHHAVYFRENGTRIGAAHYCTYKSEDGQCFILDFWVFPAYRGSGCGHRCVKVLEAYTQRDGARYYKINCIHENALRFWHDVGYTDNGMDEYDMPLLRKDIE